MLVVAYGHSKLANVLFSYELARLLTGTRMTSNSLHPGLINTNIVRNVNPILRTGFGLLTKFSGKSIEEGAADELFTSQPVRCSAKISGEYFENCNAVAVVGDNHMHDREMASRLWLKSEELTKGYLVKHQRPDWKDMENPFRQRVPD